MTLSKRLPVHFHQAGLQVGCEAGQVSHHAKRLLEAANPETQANGGMTVRMTWAMVNAGILHPTNLCDHRVHLQR